MALHSPSHSGCCRWLGKPCLPNDGVHPQSLSRQPVTLAAGIASRGAAPRAAARRTATAAASGPLRVLVHVLDSS